MDGQWGLRKWGPVGVSVGNGWAVATNGVLGEGGKNRVI